MAACSSWSTWSVRHGFSRRRLLRSWENSGFNVNAAVRIGTDAAAGRENLARYLIADQLVCPDCRGPLRIVAFFEEPRVVRAILEHLSLWDAPKPRPPPVADDGPADFEYVPGEN